MRTHVEFRFDKFPLYEGEQDEINPDMQGKRVGKYLKEKLTGEGIETDDLIPEDRGWCLPVDNDEFPMRIGCGYYQEYPDGYLCFIEPSKPVIRKSLKKLIPLKKQDM